MEKNTPDRGAIFKRRGRREYSFAVIVPDMPRCGGHAARDCFGDDTGSAQAAGRAPHG